MVPAKLHAAKNTLGLVFSLYDAVIWSLGATLLVTLGLSLFAPVTERDLAVVPEMFLVLISAPVAFGILCAILHLKCNLATNRLCPVGIVVFSILTVYSKCIFGVISPIYLI